MEECKQKPHWADRHIWDVQAFRDIAVFFVLGLLVWSIHLLQAIFLPVIIGLLLAYLLNPLVNFLEQKWSFPRVASILLLLILLIGIWVILLVWLGPIVVAQLSTLSKNIPAYVNSLTNRYAIDLGSYQDQLNGLAQFVQENLLSSFNAIFSGTGQAIDWIGSSVGFVVYVLVSFSLVPIYFFFFALNFQTMVDSIVRYVPASRLDRIFALVTKMDQAVGQFFRGRVIIAGLMSVMLSIGWFVADVPYWFLLGFGTGVLSIIPYAATLGWPVAILLKYLDMTTGTESPGFAWMAVFVWPSLVYLLVQLLEGWVLTPWIQSGSTNLSAVTILLVVFIGGSVGGIWGLILAIPVAACLKIFFEEVVRPRWLQWASEH